MSLFHQKWLTLWACGVALFGLGLAGMGFAATDGFARFFFDLVGSPVTADPGAQFRFAVGLMGCVSMGWGLTFAAAFRAAFATPDVQAATVWRMLLMAALAWYLLDSLISIATGFPLNAVSNTVLLALFLIPVIRSGVLKRA